MLKQLAAECRLQKKSFLLSLAVVAGSFLTGSVVLQILMRTDGENWIPLGSMVALMIFLFSIFLIRSYSFSQDFLLALSMGRTRKAYLTVSALRFLAENLVISLVLFLFYLLETHLYPLMFPGSITEMVIPAGFLLKFLVPLFLCSILIPLWAGTLLAVYGRNPAGILLYFIWLLSVLLAPRILLPEIHSSSFLDRIACGIHQSFVEASGSLIAGGTAVLLALLFVHTWQLSKQAAVR